MKKRTLLGVAPLLLLACVVFATVPSFASAISDSLTVFDKNGNIVVQVTATEAQEVGGAAIFTLPAGFARVAMFGKATTLCESLPCNGGSPVSNFSDIVGVVVVGGKAFFGFNSDGDPQGAAFGGQGATFLLEVPGFAYNVTQYLDPARVKAGDTAWFVSDGDVSTVPEPGTMILLGSGLIGIAGFARRRKTK